MADPMLWSEARCDYFFLIEDRTGLGDCLETAGGGFGHRDGAKIARREGWRPVRGRWCCPACLPAAKEYRDD